jgi:hypothetical protein
MLSHQQNRRRGQNRFCLELGGWGVGGRWHKQYVHMQVNVKMIKQKEKKNKARSI